MQWDDLKIFLAVCRNPRLEDAAATLGSDATTISRRLKRLERALGQTLFQRARTGHKLTGAGERLAARAEKMESVTFDILSDGPSEQLLAGRIRVGAPEGLGAMLIAPGLAAFKERHPAIGVDLIALSGFVSVPKRQADMSILLTRPTTGRLKVRKLSDYTLHMYASEAYRDEHGMIGSRADLQKHALIGYTEDLIYSSQLRYFQDMLPGLSLQYCSPSIVAQMELIRSGAGVGILPDFMARRAPDLARVLEAEVEITRTFWLAIHEDVADLARNHAFVEFLMRLNI